MPRFKPIKVNYVALYFRDWVPALYRMSTIERGIYDSLVFHIYEAGGRLENKTSLLAQISGLPEAEFVPYWEKLKHKFVHEGDFISHKRCMIELRKTDMLTKAARKGGINSAKTRSYKNGINNNQNEGGSKGLATPLQLLNETNTKQYNKETNTSDNNIREARKNINPIFNKVMDNIKPPHASGLASSISDSFLISSSSSDSFRQGDVLQLYSGLSQFLIIRNNGDRSCLDNICKWACQLVASGQKEMLFYKDILRLAEEAKLNAKSSRWGYFMDSLKRDFGYVPPSKQ